MQIRRNVSVRSRVMANAPTGTPTITLGRIHGRSAMLSAVYRPAVKYAMAVRDDSAIRTKPSAARKSSFEKPWLFNATANGGPEIVVTEYRRPIAFPNA